MRRTMRNSLALLVFLAVALWTLPAGADHPGRYTPSPESISKNMKLLGSAPKTNPASFTATPISPSGDGWPLPATTRASGF